MAHTLSSGNHVHRAQPLDNKYIHWREIGCPPFVVFSLYYIEAGDYKMTNSIENILHRKIIDFCDTMHSVSDWCWVIVTLSCILFPQALGGTQFRQCFIQDQGLHTIQNYFNQSGVTITTLSLSYNEWPYKSVFLFNQQHCSQLQSRKLGDCW